MSKLVLRGITKRYGEVAAVAGLHLELREGARQWWFESPYALVSENVIGSLVFGHGAAVRMFEAGDSLFGLPMNSQTWLPVQGGEQ